ncbi:MAG: hydrogenase expression/formation protein HypE [Chlamydiae bacterium]|nr:MAG: hydrogenase expression/formation protein HypE [Chlamydiota bacterium]
MTLQNNISLAHGSGGTQMQELLQTLIWPELDNKILREQNDSAILKNRGGELVFTTDSFVVQPIFFPGGDIGHLSICGTVNDLAMMGAKPDALSLSLIIEAGFDIESLRKIIVSIKKTADEADVKIVTGDTKVVGTGQADKIYINTSGIGWRNEKIPTGWNTVKSGDTVIVSGTIGHHGVAILAARAELPFEHELKSDAAVLSNITVPLIKKFPNIKWMRDATRGGVAAVLNELASQANFDIEIEEAKIPVTEKVRGAAEILGLDPLYLANEGRFILICPENKSEEILLFLRKYEVSKTAQKIGSITHQATPGKVVLTTEYGSRRIIDMPSGEQLPRIC